MSERAGSEALGMKGRAEEESHPLCITYVRRDSQRTSAEGSYLCTRQITWQLLSSGVGAVNSSNLTFCHTLSVAVFFASPFLF